MKFKNIGLIILLLAALIPTVEAQVPTSQNSQSSKKTKSDSKKQKLPKTVIHSWQLHNGLGLADSVTVDTSYINFPMKDAINNYSIANSYNGNIVSPLQSKIYFDRQHKIDFLFGDAYSPFLITMDDIRYYNTTTPYSTIAYKKGFTTYHEDNDLDFSFTGNLNMRTNLGATVNYLNGAGHYTNQAGKRVNLSVFGSYNGNHYTCQGGFLFNSLSNFENGGITDPSEVGGTINSEDLPVNLNAMSGLRYLSGFWNHQYSICTERDRETQWPVFNEETNREEMHDTIVTDYIPVITFQHSFEVNQAIKRYRENTAEQDFYEYNYFNRNKTSDSAQVLNIRNVLSVTFEEEFNKWLRFGATVYAVNECQRVSYSRTDTSLLFNSAFNQNISSLMSSPLHLQGDTVMKSKWLNNTWIGGAIYKNRGKWIHYGFMGDVCLIGYKLGEFRLDGHLNGNIPIGKETMTINAKVAFRNEQPSWYLQHYRSNHYRWENNFNKTYHFYAGGNVAYPTKWVIPKVGVNFENITKFIYFNSDGYPVQHDGNIQVLSVDAELNIQAKFFHFDNKVVWQMSSSDALPLPAISTYSNLYFDFWIFGAMAIQLGVDMRYNTKYYAPLLNPALGQFCTQKEAKVGNHPILNVYGNFYVKHIRLKFFAQFQHFNKYFMARDYFSMVGYPYNPPVFRAGLAWHFYN